MRGDVYGASAAANSPVCMDDELSPAPPLLLIYFFRRLTRGEYRPCLVLLYPCSYPGLPRAAKATLKHICSILRKI